MKVTHRKHTNGEVLKQTYEMNGTGLWGWGGTTITSVIQNGSALYCSQYNKKSSENHRRWKGGDKIFAGNVIARESTDKL